MPESPELDEWEMGYFNDFWELSGARTVGMGINAISFGDMLAWRSLYGLGPDDYAEEFVFLIQQMDMEFRTLQSRKEEDN